MQTKAERKTERARAKAELAIIRQDKERWMRGLENMPTGLLLQQTASLALPETRKEALVEGALIAGTAVVTYVAAGMVITPALVGAGAAIGSMAVYNVWRKNRGELQEISTRVLSYGKKMSEDKEE
jgi:hypothetical protein